MDLQSLLALRRAPLSSLDVPMAVLIEPLLAQLDSNTFLVLSKYGPDLAPLAEAEVVRLAWAVSQGALRRVLNQEIEADRGGVSPPPPEMTFGVDATYESLRALVRERWPQCCIETASYRVATDGQFVCRNIETPQVSFHFRSPQPSASDSPIAIQHRLAGA